MKDKIISGQFTDYQTSPQESSLFKTALPRDESESASAVDLAKQQQIKNMSKLQLKQFLKMNPGYRNLVKQRFKESEALSLVLKSNIQASNIHSAKMQMLITEHHSSQMMSEYSTIDERLKQLQREQK